MGSLFERGNSTAQMKVTKYIFIDGMFLERLLKDFLEEIDEEVEDFISFEHLRSDAQRVIYYDALPVKKKSQVQSDYEKLFFSKREFLNKIREQNNFHVRDGYTRNRPSEKSRIEQKGVDTWIAVDVLKYALNGVIDEAIIITSDLDLYPLFEALVETKTKGILLFDPRRTSKELIQAADVAISITHGQIVNWLPSKLKGQLSVYRAGDGRRVEKPIIENENGINWQFHFYKIGEEYWCSVPGGGKSFHSKNLASLIYKLNEEFKVRLQMKQVSKSL